jgi:outer membrane receptor for ferrienterochelin and colicins
MLLAMAPLCSEAQGQAPNPLPPATPAQRVEVQGQSLSATEERRQSLQMTTVIDRAALDRYGDDSVLDVLQRLPGVSVDGDQPRLRGLGGGYTQILLNGEPTPPGFSLEQLAPADIERIEIIKGPSAEFGAVAGTLNIILRAAPQQRQRELRANLSYRSARPVGSLHLSWGDRAGDLGFQMPVSVYQWAGANRSLTLRREADSLGPLVEQDVRGQDQWHGGGINLGPRLEWKLPLQQSVQWNSFLRAQEWGNANQRQHQVLLGPPRAIDDEATRAEGRWWMARSQLQWSRRWDDGTRLEAKASVQHSDGTSATAYEGRPNGDGPLQREIDASNQASRFAGGIKLRWPLAESHVLVAGWDVERRVREELRTVVENGLEIRTDSQGVPFDVSVQRQVAYVQDDWVLSPRLTALVGLRAEQLRNRASALQGESRSRSMLWTPLLQFRWALDDKARSLLRGSLSRSSRAPDLGTLLGRYVLNTSYERTVTNTPLAPDTAGNPQLQPERVWALELALERYLPSGGVFSVGLFHREVAGLIRRAVALETVPEATAPRWVSRPVNLGHASSSGLEVEVKGPADQWLPRWAAPQSPYTLRASLNVYRSSVEQIDDPDARLDGQPPWQATLGFDRATQGQPFGFGASLAYVPAFATVQTDLQRVSRNARPRLDAYALWRFSRELQLRLAVRDALAREQQTDSSVTSAQGLATASTLLRPAQRQFTASLTWRF